MAVIDRFEDLKSWKLARELARDIFAVSNQGTFARDYDLRSQIRRASGSVMDNIAEGFERNGTGELKQFLIIAKGSAGEVRSQLYRALDNNHLSEDAFLTLKAKAEGVSRLIEGFITYLKTSELRGSKFTASESEIQYVSEPHGTLDIEL